MDIKFVPILGDLVGEYLKPSELSQICELYDIELEYEDDGSPDTLALARTIITGLEHGNNRAFLETIVTSLVDRSRRAIGRTNWEKREHHEAMFEHLSNFETALSEAQAPSEISVPEQEPFRAKSELRDLIATAETEVTLVDNYVGAGTLDCLIDVDQRIRLMTGKASASVPNDFERALKEFRTEGYDIEVRQHPKLHDRFLLFNDRLWLVGSSFKGAGKKVLNAVEIVDNKEALKKEIESKWRAATVHSK